MALFPLRIFRVAERSMEPTIREGSYAIVYRWTGGLKAGDVIVLRSPLKDIWIIKRIERRDGDEIYVLGDNAAESEDGRKFGMVDVKTVLGKVLFTV